MTSVVLDSGALSLLAAGDARVAALVVAARAAGGHVLVPTVCLVESLSGHPRDAAVHRVLSGCSIVALDGSTARGAAVRRGAVDGDDVADPVVVETAWHHDATVLTTDPVDIGRLAAARGGVVRFVDPR